MAASKGEQAWYLQRNACILAAIIIFPAIAYACGSRGGGGGGGGCCGGCGCGCGGGGCRFRARGSKTFQPQSLWGGASALFGIDFFRERQPSGDSAPLAELSEQSQLAKASPTAAALPQLASTLRDPNEAFYACCVDRHLPDACLSKCNFKAYNKQLLTAMYFRRDGCPLAALNEMQFCAAQGRDHRECCIRNGVASTIAGPKCLVFCDQRPGVTARLDTSYLPCFDRFENMKSCFWQDVGRYFRR